MTTDAVPPNSPPDADLLPAAASPPETLAPEPEEPKQEGALPPEVSHGRSRNLILGLVLLGTVVALIILLSRTQKG